MFSKLEKKVEGEPVLNCGERLCCNWTGRVCSKLGELIFFLNVRRHAFLIGMEVCVPNLVRRLCFKWERKIVF